MNIRLNSNIIFREFTENCYLKNESNGTEIVINKTAGLFYSLLNKEWQDFDLLMVKIYEKFSIEDKDKKSVYNDFVEIVNYLKDKDFIDVIHEEKEDNTIKYENNYDIKNINNCESQLFIGTFIVTEDCDNKCLHCYNSYLTREARYMTKDVFDKGLEEFIKMGVVTICISGGEALLHPNFMYFLDKISKTDCRFRLYTNGQNINRELCKKMATMSLSPASITLYSIHPEVHDRITQHKGSWNATVAGLKLFKEYSIPFTISVPLTNLNLEDFEDLFDFCIKELKAISVGPNPFISYTVNHNKTNSSVIPSIKQMEQFARDYYKYSIDRGYSILPEKNIKTGDYRVFQNGYYADLDILPNGNVVTGTLLPDVSLGNIVSDSLSDIWTKSEILNSWKTIDLKTLKNCENCSVRDYCDPNIGDNWVANEDVTKVDEHLCALYRIYYKTILELENKKNIK